LCAWQWKIAEIEERTQATLNVVAMIQSRLRKVDGKTLKMLDFAACLGHSFSEDTLYLVWSSLHREEEKSQDTEAAFAQLLQQSINEGFLERSDDSKLHFVHDRVKEAVMCQCEGEIAALQYDVGKVLVEKLSAESLETNIFVVSELLKDAKEISIAKLHLKASQKAKSMSAFSNAAHFARSGINGLSDPWLGDEETKELALDLYSTGAEAEINMGNMDTVKQYCSQVLAQKDIPTTDKKRAYNVLMQQLYESGDVEKALSLGFEILDELGSPIPTNPVKFAYTTFKNIKRLKPPPTQEFLESRPLLTDPVKIMCIETLTRLNTYAYYAGKKLLTLLVVTQLAYMSVKHGLCEHSMPAFASVGPCFILLGDVETGRKYSELSVNLIGKRFSQNTDARSISVGYYLGLSWSRPIQSTYSILYEGYKIGLQMGDLENAILSIQCQLWSRVYGSHSLSLINEDWHIYVSQMESLNMAVCIRLSRICWQSIQHLMGLSENTDKLTGAVMDEDSFIETTTKLSKDKDLVNIHMWNKFTQFYLGNYEACAKLALKYGDEVLKVLFGCIDGVFDAFARSVSLFAVARTKRSRKHGKEAIRLRKLMSKWVNDGNPTAVHLLMILDAEYLAWKGKPDKALEAYREAIVIASRSGFLQNAALASERFADTLQEVKGTRKEETIKYRIEQAIRGYSEWGAGRKVELLEEKYRDLLLSEY